MYLIHARLRAEHPGPGLPFDTEELLLATARPEERIEHIAVHRPEEREPVLGVFLLADSLEEAEAVVARLCRRAFSTGPLGSWEVLQVGAPLVAPFYERLLAGPGPDGRISPGPIPSS